MLLQSRNVSKDREEELQCTVKKSEAAVMNVFPEDFVMKHPIYMANLIQKLQQSGLTQ